LGGIVDRSDYIALVLALTLAVFVVLAMAIGIANVLNDNNPPVFLDNNETQVLTAALGGIIGILGSYLGGRKQRKDD
jgi:hypothetical protein